MNRLPWWTQHSHLYVTSSTCCLQTKYGKTIRKTLHIYIYIILTKQSNKLPQRYHVLGVPFSKFTVLVYILFHLRLSPVRPSSNHTSQQKPWDLLCCLALCRFLPHWPSNLRSAGFPVQCQESCYDTLCQFHAIVQGLALFTDQGLMRTTWPIGRLHAQDSFKTCITQHHSESIAQTHLTSCLTNMVYIYMYIQTYFSCIQHLCSRPKAEASSPRLAGAVRLRSGKKGREPREAGAMARRCPGGQVDVGFLSDFVGVYRESSRCFPKKMTYICQLSYIFQFSYMIMMFHRYQPSHAMTSRGPRVSMTCWSLPALS